MFNGDPNGPELAEYLKVQKEKAQQEKEAASAKNPNGSHLRSLDPASWKSDKKPPQMRDFSQKAAENVYGRLSETFNIATTLTQHPKQKPALRLLQDMSKYSTSEECRAPDQYIINGYITLHLCGALLNNRELNAFEQGLVDLSAGAKTLQPGEENLLKKSKLELFDHIYPTLSQTDSVVDPITAAKAALRYAADPSSRIARGR